MLEKEGKEERASFPLLSLSLSLGVCRAGQSRGSDLPAASWE